MNPAELIDRLLMVPYAPGKGEMSGADCWGIVELWYQHVLGIELEDRATHPPGHGGVQAGFEAAANWEPIEAPEDHCLVVMRAGRLSAGHVGVFYHGSVLHSEERTGCIYEPASSRIVRVRTTGYLRYRARL